MISDLWQPPAGSSCRISCRRPQPTVAWPIRHVPAGGARRVRCEGGAPGRGPRANCRPGDVCTAQRCEARGRTRPQVRVGPAVATRAGVRRRRGHGGQPTEWLGDERLRSPEDRRANQAELRARLDASIAAIDSDQLIEIYDLPLTAFSPPDSATNEQLALRGFGSGSGSHVPPVAQWPALDKSQDDTGGTE